MLSWQAPLPVRGGAVFVPPPAKVAGVTAKSAMAGFAAPPQPNAKACAFGGPKAVGPRPIAPTKTATTAFAVLPTDNGPVLAPPSSVPNMLKADWALFLELACYSLHGQMEGRIAFGIEEVSEAIAQANVAVLFIPVSCGHGGESSVRGVAMCGGRGYIVGSAHELYEDIDDWGAAAILHNSLACTKPATSEPPAKRPKIDSTMVLAAATPKSAAMAPAGQVAELAAVPSVPQPDALPEEAAATVLVPAAIEKQLRRDLKMLGTSESLGDKASIPRTTESARDKYLPTLGAKTVFTLFADVFNRAKGVAHRKAILYVVHELFMGKKGVTMKEEGHRLNCLEHFLIRIGGSVKGFKTVERQAYIKAANTWTQYRVLLPSELSQLKDAWDMD